MESNFNITDKVGNIHFVNVVLANSENKSQSYNVSFIPQEIKRKIIFSWKWPFIRIITCYNKLEFVDITTNGM